MSASHPDALVQGVAAPFALVIDPSTRARLVAYFTLLVRWNARINLTGAASVDALIRDHLPDSLALASLVARDARLIDVGSGGGLPALPFAILRPDVALTLVEPRAKRVAFLRTACREAGVIASIESCRIEDFAGLFDAASSMATFPPAAWVTRARALLAPGGKTIVFLRDPNDLPRHHLVDRTLDYGVPSRPRYAVVVSQDPGPDRST